MSIFIKRKDVAFGATDIIGNDTARELIAQTLAQNLTQDAEKQAALQTCIQTFLEKFIAEEGLYLAHITQDASKSWGIETFTSPQSEFYKVFAEIGQKSTDEIYSLAFADEYKKMLSETQQQGIQTLLNKFKTHDQSSIASHASGSQYLVDSLPSEGYIKLGDLLHPDELKIALQGYAGKHTVPAVTILDEELDLSDGSQYDKLSKAIQEQISIIEKTNVERSLLVPVQTGLGRNHFIFLEIVIKPDFTSSVTLIDSKKKDQELIAQTGDINTNIIATVQGEVNKLTSKKGKQCIVTKTQLQHTGEQGQDANCGFYVAREMVRNYNNRLGNAETKDNPNDLKNASSSPDINVFKKAMVQKIARQRFPGNQQEQQWITDLQISSAGVVHTKDRTSKFEQYEKGQADASRQQTVPIYTAPNAIATQAAILAEIKQNQEALKSARAPAASTQIPVENSHITPASPQAPVQPGNFNEPPSSGVRLTPEDERAEQRRLEAELAEFKRVEREQAEAEARAQAETAAERVAAEKAAAEKAAAEKAAAEKAAAEKAAAERAAAERAAAEKAAADLASAELKAAAERAAAEKTAADKAAAEKAAAERAAAEKAAADLASAELKAAAERAAAEKTAADKAAAEKAAADLASAELKAAAEKAAAEKAAAEKAVAEKVEAEKVAAARAAAEPTAAELKNETDEQAKKAKKAKKAATPPPFEKQKGYRAGNQKQKKERVIAAKAAADRVAAEKAAAEKAAAEKAAAEKAAAEKAAAEKAAAEKAAAEKAAAEKAATEKAAAERAAAEKAAADLASAELKAAADRAAAEKAAAEKEKQQQELAKQEREKAAERQERREQVEEKLTQDRQKQQQQQQPVDPLLTKAGQMRAKEESAARAQVQQAQARQTEEAKTNAATVRKSEAELDAEEARKKLEIQAEEKLEKERSQQFELDRVKTAREMDEAFARLRPAEAEQKPGQAGNAVPSEVDNKLEQKSQARALADIYQTIDKIKTADNQYVTDMSSRRDELCPSVVRALDDEDKGDPGLFGAIRAYQGSLNPLCNYNPFSEFKLAAQDQTDFDVMVAHLKKTEWIIELIIAQRLPDQVDAMTFALSDSDFNKLKQTTPPDDKSPYDVIIYNALYTQATAPIQTITPYIEWLETLIDNAETLQNTLSPEQRDTDSAKTLDETITKLKEQHQSLSRKEFIRNIVVDLKLNMSQQKDPLSTKTSIEISTFIDKLNNKNFTPPEILSFIDNTVTREEKRGIKLLSDPIKREISGYFHHETQTRLTTLIDYMKGVATSDNFYYVMNQYFKALKTEWETLQHVYAADAIELSKINVNLKLINDAIHAMDVFQENPEMVQVIAEGFADQFNQAEGKQSTPQKDIQKLLLAANKALVSPPTQPFDPKVNPFIQICQKIQDTKRGKLGISDEKQMALYFLEDIKDKWFLEQVRNKYSSTDPKVLLKTKQINVLIDQFQEMNVVSFSQVVGLIKVMQEINPGIANDYLQMACALERQAIAGKIVEIMDQTASRPELKTVNAFSELKLRIADNLLAFATNALPDTQDEILGFVIKLDTLSEEEVLLFLDKTVKRVETVSGSHQLISEDVKHQVEIYFHSKTQASSEVKIEQPIEPAQFHDVMRKYLIALEKEWARLDMIYQLDDTSKAAFEIKFKLVSDAIAAIDKFPDDIEIMRKVAESFASELWELEHTIARDKTLVQHAIPAREQISHLLGGLTGTPLPKAPPDRKGNFGVKGNNHFAALCTGIIKTRKTNVYQEIKGEAVVDKSLTTVGYVKLIRDELAARELELGLSATNPYVVARRAMIETALETLQVSMAESYILDQLQIGLKGLKTSDKRLAAQTETVCHQLRKFTYHIDTEYYTDEMGSVCRKAALELYRYYYDKKLTEKSKELKLFLQTHVVKLSLLDVRNLLRELEKHSTPEHVRPMLNEACAAEAKRFGKQLAEELKLPPEQRNSKKQMRLNLAIDLLEHIPNASSPATVESILNFVDRLSNQTDSEELLAFIHNTIDTAEISAGQFKLLSADSRLMIEKYFASETAKIHQAIIEEFKEEKESVAPEQFYSKINIYLSALQREWEIVASIHPFISSNLDFQKLIESRIKVVSDAIKALDKFQNDNTIMQAISEELVNQLNRIDSALPPEHKLVGTQDAINDVVTALTKRDVVPNPAVMPFELKPHNQFRDLCVNLVEVQGREIADELKDHKQLQEVLAKHDLKDPAHKLQFTKATYELAESVATDALYFIRDKLALKELEKGIASDHEVAAGRDTLIRNTVRSIQGATSFKIAANLEILYAELNKDKETQSAANDIRQTIYYIDTLFYQDTPLRQLYGDMATDLLKYYHDKKSFDKSRELRGKLKDHASTLTFHDARALLAEYANIFEAADAKNRLINVCAAMAEEIRGYIDSEIDRYIAAPNNPAYPIDRAKQDRIRLILAEELLKNIEHSDSPDRTNAILDFVEKLYKIKFNLSNADILAFLNSTVKFGEEGHADQLVSLAVKQEIERYFNEQAESKKQEILAGPSPANNSPAFSQSMQGYLTSLKAACEAENSIYARDAARAEINEKKLKLISDAIDAITRFEDSPEMIQDISEKLSHELAELRNTLPAGDMQAKLQTVLSDIDQLLTHLNQAPMVTPKPTATSYTLRDGNQFREFCDAKTREKKEKRENKNADDFKEMHDHAVEGRLKHIRDYKRFTDAKDAVDQKYDENKLNELKAKRDVDKKDGAEFLTLVQEIKTNAAHPGIPQPPERKAFRADVTQRMTADMIPYLVSVRDAWTAYELAHDIPANDLHVLQRKLAINTAITALSDPDNEVSVVLRTLQDNLKHELVHQPRSGITQAMYRRVSSTKEKHDALVDNTQATFEEIEQERNRIDSILAGVDKELETEEKYAAKKTEVRQRKPFVERSQAYFNKFTALAYNTHPRAMGEDFKTADFKNTETVLDDKTWTKLRGGKLTDAKHQEVHASLGGKVTQSLGLATNTFNEYKYNSADPADPLTGTEIRESNKNGYVEMSVLKKPDGYEAADQKSKDNIDLLLAEKRISSWMQRCGVPIRLTDCKNENELKALLVICMANDLSYRAPLKSVFISNDHPYAFLTDPQVLDAEVAAMRAELAAQPNRQIRMKPLDAKQMIELKTELATIRATPLEDLYPAAAAAGGITQEQKDQHDAHIASLEKLITDAEAGRYNTTEMKAMREKLRTDREEVSAKSISPYRMH